MSASVPAEGPKRLDATVVTIAGVVAFGSFMSILDGTVVKVVIVLRDRRPQPQPEKIVTEAPGPLGAPVRAPVASDRA